MLIIKLLQSALIKRKKMKYNRTIIVDVAHTKNTAGKRSPDGKFREYLWSRNIMAKVVDKLEDMGVPVIYSYDPDLVDDNLTRRKKNMNAIIGPAYVFSLHSNACGMGDVWYSARGASIWTTRGLTKSDEFATIIFNQLLEDFPDIQHWRKDYSDDDVDYEANFTVLMSVHPSVLLEWLFQDNKEDVKLLMDPAINDRLVDSLVKSLCAIAKL